MVYNNSPNQIQTGSNLLNRCEAYCINLETRPDRWEKVQQQFALLSLQNVQRYAAKTDVSIRNTAPTNGEHSVIETNLELLCVCHRSKPILIFQDDVYFLMECHPLETMDKITAQLPDDFGILYLGAHLFDPKIKHPLVTPNLVKMQPEPNLRLKKIMSTLAVRMPLSLVSEALNLSSLKWKMSCSRRNGTCFSPNTWCRPFLALWPTRHLHFKSRIFRILKASKPSAIGLSNTIRKRLRKANFQSTGFNGCSQKFYNLFRGIRKGVYSCCVYINVI